MMGTISCNPFRWISPWPCIVSLHVCTHWVCSWILEGGSLQISTVLFLSSLVLSLWTLAWTLSFVSSREFSGLYLNSSSVCCHLETLKVVIWVNHRTQLICFPFPRHHCPLLLGIQCHKSLFHIFLSVFWLLQVEGWIQSLLVLVKSRSPMKFWLLYVTLRLMIAVFSTKGLYMQ